MAYNGCHCMLLPCLRNVFCLTKVGYPRLRPPARGVDEESPLRGYLHKDKGRKGEGGGGAARKEPR